jgi:RNA polymerase sigma factor (sigma-70 family)
MPTDGELLRSYADAGDDAAFTTLVRRHINVVYRTALRRVGGNAHAADDVTQRVFTALARKAGALKNRVSLAGWLYTSTRFAAAELVRAEQRRRAHEQEAHTMNELHATPKLSTRVEPWLDEVMDVLPDRDREAVLLHFFEGHSFGEVGAALSLSPDATRMRVNRALERLRGALEKRGVASTAAALATALATQSIMAAPEPLATTVAGHALSEATATFGQLGKFARLLQAMKNSAVTPWAAGGLAVAIIALVITTNWPPSSAPADLTVSEPLANNTGFTISPVVAVPAKLSTTVAGLKAESDNKIAADSAGTVIVGREFSALSEQEKNILAMLWQQQEEYPPMPNLRFGLKIGLKAPNAAGVAPLRRKGWIGILRSTGMIVLTSRGREFCAAHPDEIAAHTRNLASAMPAPNSRRTRTNRRRGHKSPPAGSLVSSRRWTAILRRRRN